MSLRGKRNVCIFDNDDSHDLSPFQGIRVLINFIILSTNPNKKTILKNAFKSLITIESSTFFIMSCVPKLKRIFNYVIHKPVHVSRWTSPGVWQVMHSDNGTKLWRFKIWLHYKLGEIINFDFIFGGQAIHTHN